MKYVVNCLVEEISSFSLDRRILLDVKPFSCVHNSTTSKSQLEFSELYHPSDNAIIGRFLFKYSQHVKTA